MGKAPKSGQRMPSSSSPSALLFFLSVPKQQKPCGPMQCTFSLYCRTAIDWQSIMVCAKCVQTLVKLWPSGNTFVDNSLAARYMASSCYPVGIRSCCQAAESDYTMLNFRHSTCSSLCLLTPTWMPTDGVGSAELEEC